MQTFKTRRSGGDEQRAIGEVVRRCGICQESNMVLRQNKVIILTKYLLN